MKQGKIWGATELIKSNTVFEVHRIEIEKGGYCSLHKHTHKYNGFYVERGKLRIIIHKSDYDLVDITDLDAGDYTEVAPGEYHKFVAFEPTIAYEYYWAAELNPKDIQRKDHGGHQSGNQNFDE